MNNEHPTARHNLRPVTVTFPKAENHSDIEGLLHGFFLVTESADCAYPVGIIESEDGQIYEVQACYVRFTDR